MSNSSSYHANAKRALINQIKAGGLTETQKINLISHIKNERYGNAYFYIHNHKNIPNWRKRSIEEAINKLRNGKN